MGKIIGIVSLKGGVGKTTTVCNLATCLANDFKKKILVIDTNISAPNLGLHLGITELPLTLEDVLDNKELATDVIHKHEYGFDIITSSLRKSNTDTSKLREKIVGLKRKYDLVLLDTAPTYSEEFVAAIKASDVTLVISTSDLPSLSAVMRARSLLKQNKTPLLGVVLNKVLNKKFELQEDDIERLSEVPIVSIIPENLIVEESLSKVKPIVSLEPKCNVSLAYKRLASALIDAEVEPLNFYEKYKQFLKEDYLDFKNKNSLWTS